MLIVRQVKFNQCRHISAKEILSRSNIRLGQTLYSLDLPQIATRIEQHPWVKHVTIRRTMWGLVELTITEWRPVAIWVGQTGSMAYVADDGTPFSKVDFSNQQGEFDLTMITNVAEQPTVRRALQILKSLRGHPNFKDSLVGELYRSTDRIWAVQFQGESARVVIDSTDVERQLSRAFQVLLDLKRKMIVARSIDCAFRDKVVVDVGFERKRGNSDDAKG